MKKLTVLFFLLIIAVCSYSQEFRVKSMLELTHDLSARTSPRFDKSGVECALIRVNIPTIKDVYFQSPIVGDPIQAPGEYTVYVPANTERLQMICDNKQVDIVFADFSISPQPKSSYRVVVTKDFSPNEASGHAKVTVTANYDDDILLIDGIPAGQLPLVLDDLSLGKHTFAVPNTNGRTCNDTVITITSKVEGIFLNLRKEKRQVVPLDFDFYDGEGGSYVKPLWGVRYEKKNGKEGLVGYDGSIIIPFEYEEISKDDYGGYFLVKKRVNGRSCTGVYIPGKGEVMPCRYYYTWWENSNRNLLYAFEYGIDGKQLSNPKSHKEWVRLFDCKTGKFILSGITGNYTDVKVYNNEYIMAVNEDQHTEIMNIRGSSLLTIPYFLNVYFDPVGKLAVKTWHNEEGDECRIYDLSGRTYIISSQYHYRFHWISDGLLCVEDINTHRIGYIDKDMREIIPIKYYKKDAFCENDYGFKHGIISLETENGDQVVFDNKGRVIVQTTPGGISSYKKITVRDDGRIICEKNTGEMGVVDSAGHIIVPFTRCEIKSWNDDDFFVIKEADEYVTIIDIFGGTILPRTKIERADCGLGGCYSVGGNPLEVSIYTNDYFLKYNNHGQCVTRIPLSSNAELTEGWGEDACGLFRIRSKKGNSIVFSTNDDNLFLIKNKSTNKIGYLSTTGELLTSCIYDEIIEMFDVKGYIDSLSSALGQLSSDFESDINCSINVYSASEGYGIVGIGGRYGYINTKGKVVLPLNYTAVTPFINGEAFVRDGNYKWSKIYSKDLK